MTHARFIPNGGDANFDALRICQHLAKQDEQPLHVLLEALDDIFENGKHNKRANFAMSSLCRGACMLEERKKLIPSSKGDLDAGDGSDDTSS